MDSTKLSKSENTKREYYIDVARVLAMVAVIVIHVGAISWYDGPYSLYPWGVYNLFDILSRFCVPIFLMISGYLFLDPKKNISVKKIYTKYLPRIITAFLFWGFLYALITSGFITQRTLGNGVGWKLVQDTFWGHYHMWYLYLVVGLYMITPALRPIATDRKAMKYFLILSYIVSYLVPTIQWIPFVYEHTGKYTGRLELSFVCGFVFYYLAGYYFATEDFTKKQKKLIYGIGVVGILFMLFTTTYFVISMQYPETNYHEYYTASAPLFSVATYLLFREKFANVNPNTKVMKAVLWMSKMSFGVYLAHDFGLIVFKKIGFTPAVCTPFISMPLLTILDLIISLSIVFVVSRIPVLKKWVI